jgi:hypothetical protein
MSKKLVLGYIPMGTGRVSPFDQVFTGEPVLVRPDKPETFGSINAMVVWGGEDISPSIYNEKVSDRTYASAELSRRDKYEVVCCKIAIEKGIPIIGVCRGAQLLCALAGGKLVQHVNNHGRSHMITTKDGRNIWSSSVHHQMMYPWDVKDHDLIAWSTEKQSDVYIGGDDKDMEHLHMGYVEPEIVYFPNIKGLAIQGHPEFMGESCPFVQYCNELVQDYLIPIDITTNVESHGLV